MSKGVALSMEIAQEGLDKGHRYLVTVGDGSRSEVFLLASNMDQYGDSRWTFLLGDPLKKTRWQTDSSQIYVSVCRQYPNPDFDFKPESYQHYEWLIADIEVSHFRLHNPWIGWPTLDWPFHDTWNGGSIKYGQDESHEFKYSIDEYGFKFNEKDEIGRAHV